MAQIYPISIQEIATWLINRVDRDAGDSITHLKLQKLLYYVEAWFLANNDSPLFAESPEAWRHGPVYKSMYRKYKKNEYHALQIEKNGRCQLKDKDLQVLVEAVYDEYGKFSAKKLEEMTHLESPWLLTRNGIPLHEHCDKPMDKLLIRNFYAEKIDKPAITELST